ncbi:putative Ubiquitin conjugating enzyme [Trypanosoma vivax]|uniref:E2 ubiquitin-conjugating enzyme n=1 Tax=Trypanosoma vivax (strain Y486) TaxID=1055687 RepID=G0TRV1_TRYVY|nr:putative ubiquitin-conjugating enzyme [Trypanosoma vivax]KAH8617428.1 putative Ubiquitin conjugating enzyme [Trypanosoma vivax]CCC46673.1 putative ubiquitin-conjugating enzyme [Trypanosoma vivax Y486]
MPISASAMRLVMRQVQDIESNPTDGVLLHRSDDLSKLFFEIIGPEGTPFAGGTFHVVLYFDEGYPQMPPRGVFRTKIFHPNIAEKGEICVNVLKRDWKPNLDIRHVITVIRCLLIEPNAESALNEEAARLLLEDYEAFKKKAYMMTKVHAMRAGRSHSDIVLSQSKSNADVSSSQEPQLSIGMSQLDDVSTPEEGHTPGRVVQNALRPSPVMGTLEAKEQPTAAVVTSQRATEKKRAALRRI